MRILLSLLLALLVPTPSWAGRLFDGTNDALQSASALALNGTTKYAISFWGWRDGSNQDDFFLEYGATVGGGSITDNRFLVNAISSASGSVRFQINGNAGLSQNVDLNITPSAAAWHHYVVNVDLTLNTNCIVTVYVDGSSVGFARGGTSGLFAADVMADNVLNVASRNNTSNFIPGSVADLAIWTGAGLSSGNVTSLNGGTLPPDVTVSGGTLAYYWKLCGTDSPETATTGSINMTVNGGAGQRTHPSAVSASCPGGTVLQNSTGFLGAIIQ